MEAKNSGCNSINGFDSYSGRSLAVVESIVDGSVSTFFGGSDVVGVFVLLSAQLSKAPHPCSGSLMFADAGPTSMAKHSRPETAAG